MWGDVLYAIRGLQRSPIFTLAATLALGLAIGANGAIFGLIDGLWFRPPGVPQPETIVRILGTTADDKSLGWSYPEYRTLAGGTRAFAGVAARGRRGAFMANPGGAPDLLLVNVVSTNFFDVLGVRPAAGRLFQTGDEPALAAQPGVVLGHAFWVRRLGGDPLVVGRDFDLLRGGRPFPVRILAILPATFRDLEAGADRDIWMPPETWQALAGRAEFERRDDRWFDVIGRRRSSVAVSAANEDVQAVASTMASDFPNTNAGRGARAISDFAWRYENGGTNAAALVGLVLLVVLITCVNVANLLLARGAARGREVAVRVAIGASRGRLIRQLMVESAVLGLCGAVVGILVAAWLLGLVPALLVAPPGFRSFLVFQTDGRVLAFTLLTTLATTFLFGVVPSVVATRADLVALMKGGTTVEGAGPAAERLRQVLIVGQVAISLVLLSGAAVLGRSFLQTEHADIGVTRTPVLTAWISGADIRRPQIERAADALRALPGVRRVGYAFRAPLSLSGGGLSMPVFFPDTPPAAREGLPSVKYNPVGGDYFAAMGIFPVRGRVLVDADQDVGETPIVVNETFVHRFFPGRDALGTVVRPGGRTAPPARIVGIVPDGVINEIGEKAEPYFYVPFWRQPVGEITLLLATDGDAAAAAPAVKGALKAIDPELEPTHMVTLREYIAYSGSTVRATASLGALLSGIGLVLTVLGVYGVVAYRTERRKRELGIRIALGAERRAVLSLVMRDGARVALFGVGIGVPIALAGTRLLASLLFRVSAWDPLAFVVASTILFVAVCAAAAVPAMRATALSPSSVLRDS